MPIFLNGPKFGVDLFTTSGFLIIIFLEIITNGANEAQLYDQNEYQSLDFVNFYLQGS